MAANLKEQWEAAPLWQRVILVVIFPTVVIGAIWFYVIKPDIEKKKRLIQEKIQLAQEINRYRKLIRPEVLENLKKQLEGLKEQEEEKKKELERVIGKIPSRKEIEKVFGEISRIASARNLVITRIVLSEPKVQNLQLIEVEGKKFVKVMVQQQQKQQARGFRSQQKKKRTSQKTDGVPVTVMEISMSLEGRTEDVYSFLKSIHRKGLVSYPKSVKIKPIENEGMVNANVVIDVILQE